MAFAIERKWRIVFPNDDSPRVLQTWSPYNANTFPKSKRWIDNAGRWWVYIGKPGIFDYKLPRDLKIGMPDIGNKLVIQRGKTRIHVRVRGVWPQDRASTGLARGSQTVGRCQLEVIN